MAERTQVISGRPAYGAANFAAAALGGLDWDTSGNPVIKDKAGAVQATFTTSGASITGVTIVDVTASATEINYNDGATPGTAVVSKTAVLGANKDLDTLRLTAGATTAATALAFGTTLTEGLEIKVLDEVVTTTNAVSTAMTNAIPAGAVILSVQANLDSAVTGDGSGDDLFVKIGIGVSGNKVQYGVATALTKNTKVDTIPDWAVLAGATTLSIWTIKTDGTTAATEKFSAGGSVRIRVVYATTNSLDDHA